MRKWGGLLGEIDLGRKKDTLTPENITIHQPTNPLIYMDTYDTHHHTAGR